MAQSLTKSSASLVAAGGDLAEAAALTATANAIIQDADSVGTALKTTSLRLRGTDVKVLEEEGLDSEGAVTSKSKLQSKVKALSGVDILTATGEYKSTYEILSDIADVWESINDMDQAALLELISGKRNSSVIAAILQSPQELKAAYEDAMNAEGSALKENEKYLDSIQGRIDQFNNAMQSMWSNTLNSEMVKGFVSLGTEIVKIIDKIGLLNAALITLATVSMIKNKMGPIAFLGGISDIIRDVVGKVGGFIGSLTSATAATSAYTAETLAASVANGTLSASEAASIASKNGLALATTNLTAAEAAEMLMKAGVAKADALAMVAKLGLTSSTQALSLAVIEAAVSSGALTAAQGAQIASALGLTAANTGLAASLKALWTALWPILAVVAGVAVIWGAVKLIDHLIVTTEELTEELNGLKSELQDIQSEIDSVNSELETMDDRMSELLAKDSLTFTEEQELERLQAENAELQRKLDLLEQEEEFKQKEVARKFNQTMASANSDDYYVTGEKKKWWNYVVDGIAEAITPGSSGATANLENVLASKIKIYENYATQLADIETKMANTTDNGEYDKLSKEKKRIDKEMSEIEAYIGEKTKEFNGNAEGLDYFTGGNLEGWQIESNKNLDKIKSLNDKWAIAQGGTNAKSNAIQRIFSKDEYDEASDVIDGLVKQLAKDPTDQTVLSKISAQCKAAESDLKAVGLSVQDATDYFTMLGQNAAFDTIEGKTAEITSATSKLQTLLSNTKSADFTGLFSQGGEVSATAIAEYFKGTSEATRTEIARLVKNIHDGEMTVKQAMKSFAAFGMLESWKIIEAEVSELNTNVFKDLGDEISGIINTVKELSSAFESVASSIELVDRAQAEMAYSGHLSVETALQLMESTDDWNRVLEIENGNIKLVKGAEDALVQTKLDLIKTNLQTALSTVEAQLAQITATEASADMAYTIEESTNLAVTQLAGNMAYLTEMMTAYTRAAAGENVDMSAVTKSAEDAKAKVLADTNYKKNEAERIGREGLEKEKARLETMLDVYATVDTPSDFRSNYSSDEVSGGNATKKDAKDDLFKREMDYWENRIAANQARYEQLQNEIDLLEKKGQKADASYYQEQAKLEGERLELLNGQKKAAQAYLATLTEGSEEWF